MKVRITDIHPRSCHQNLLNCIAEIEEKEMRASEEKERAGWFEAWVKLQGETEKKWIYGFKYEPVEEPAMSELAGRVEIKINMDEFRKETDRIYDSLRIGKGTFLKEAIKKAAKYTVDSIKDEAEWNQRFTNFNKAAYPKKLSWLQKIRGYDSLKKAHEAEKQLNISLLKQRVDLQARCQSAESMRDHYKQVSELHETVSKQWQQKAIEANLDYLNCQSEKVNEKHYDKTGRRLKFSVGHNHIEIVVGNPAKHLKWKNSKHFFVQYRLRYDVNLHGVEVEAADLEDALQKAYQKVGSNMQWYTIKEIE